jgi:hypothetical protein
MPHSEGSPIRVVFAPDVIGKSFQEPDCVKLMHRWRDGIIQPVVNADLLRRYFKLLKGMGLSEELVRRWGWWLTASEKSHFLESVRFSELNGQALCAQVALQAGARCVLYAVVCDSRFPALTEIGRPVPWVRVNEFLKELE